jgi:hypothetical protein
MDRTASWHWYARIGDMIQNSAANGARYASKEEARVACVAWVKATLERK